MIRYILRRFQVKTEDYPKYRFYLASLYAFFAANAFIYGFWLILEPNLPNTPEKKDAFREKMKNRNYNVTYVNINGLTATVENQDDTTSIPKEDSMIE